MLNRMTKSSRRYIYVSVFIGIAAMSGRSLLAQERVITLQQAIQLAQENSFEYKVALNSYQSSIWTYRNFSASFRPMLYLDGTIPNYSRAITKITLPSGEDAFVSQNQAFSSLNLGVRQNVALTGGTIAIGSSLNRIDVFGVNRQVSYSTIPASISYYQDAIGYNAFKWQKQIEPLRFEAADRKFVANMLQIAGQTVTYYFDMLSAQLQRELSEQNLNSADTLYAIAQERFRIGTISKSELLQLRLNVLNAKHRLTQDSVNFVLTRQRFARYAILPEENTWKLISPDSTSFFEISFEEALTQASANNPQIIDFKAQQLEAEQQLAQTRAEANIKFNIQANFGLSNTAPKLPGLFNYFENQQNILIGFSAPILDWGFSKTQRLRAEANLALIGSQIEQDRVKLEQEIALQTARWSLHQQQLQLVVESKIVAEQNYELEKRRYLSGSITINDFNVAQQQKDNAANGYLEAIRVYWDLLYTIKRLTLYDFEKQKRLSHNVHSTFRFNDH